LVVVFGTEVTRMAIDFETEREQVHALLDQLPPGKLSAVRRLLEVLVGDDAEGLSAADRLAIQASLRKHGTVSMEVVLADFGLTMADFEAMADEPESLPTAEVNG